jgi:hypothetical protein
MLLFPLHLILYKNYPNVLNFVLLADNKILLCCPLLLMLVHLSLKNLYFHLSASDVKSVLFLPMHVKFSLLISSQF